MSTFSNAVDNTLHGQTGSGAFVGATGPTMSLPNANNVLEGYTTTVSSATTITLTNTSNFQQFITGSTAQTVALPLASTCVLGQSFIFANASSASVTVQSSGGNTVIAIPAGVTATVTCILASGTSAASWYTEGAITGPIVGGTSGNPQGAGYVGQVISTSIPSGSQVNLTDNASANIMNISLTAGNWLVWGNIFVTPTDSTTLVEMECWISTASSPSLPDASLRSELYAGSQTGLNIGGIGITAPNRVFYLTSTTTVYIACMANFQVSTAGACGQLAGLRVF